MFSKGIVLSHFSFDNTSPHPTDRTHFFLYILKALSFQYFSDLDHDGLHCILTGIFTLAGSSHKCACNCKRIWERTGLDIKCKCEPSQFCGAKILFLDRVVTTNFKIVVMHVFVLFSHIGINVMCPFVLKFWTFLYSHVLAQSAKFCLSRLT